LISGASFNAANPLGALGFKCFSNVGGCVTATIVDDSWATMPLVEVRGRADR
jgi:hypothetical protein